MKQNVHTLRTRTGVIEPKAKPIKNADGESATARKAKGELFLLGAGRFFGEDSFYEKPSEAQARYIGLIHKVTKSDPAWVANFLKWLRNEGNIRTGAIVGAAEYVAAGGPNGRSVVKSVIVRGDEPAEMLAYWLNKHGRNIPQPIKRGIRDSAVRLYDERNFAKWDSNNNAVRMADVVELTHPSPRDSRQNDLFKYMLEDRHGRANFEGKTLPALMGKASCESRADYLRELAYGNPAITWENVSSAGTGSMTGAEWLQVYGYMGYMAKLRNLRNLDKAGVTSKDKRKIGEWLADPADVAKSRQLPMRFYAAYREVQDDVWRGYLEEALDASLANIPVLKGKWLVLIDASGSMGSFYGRGDTGYYGTASLFGAAFAKANKADLRTFSNGISPLMPVEGKNVLRIVKDLQGGNYWFAGGTDTARCLKAAFAKGKYDGVVIVTDEQYNGWGGDPGKQIPADIPLYTFNIAGYRAGHSIGENRVTVGGLTDAAFGMIANIESARAKWPWE